MKFDNVQDVKKWFRNITFCKKELEMKIRFYKELFDDFNDAPYFSNTAEYYKEQIDALHWRLKRLTDDIDRLLELLEDEERMVLMARYINLIRWDYIEFQVYYSRRQAIRIHDRAVSKLVGQTVGGC